VVRRLKDNGKKEKIIAVLEKHPEGLTMKEIAKAIGMHRINVSKYIYELIGAGIVKERTIGSAKLCYLKKVKEDE
jgi:DNA-binding IclR family transcriptional regulator